MLLEVLDQILLIPVDASLKMSERKASLFQSLETKRKETFNTLKPFS
jgi:hypothetical protein